MKANKTVCRRAIAVAALLLASAAAGAAPPPLRGAKVPDAALERVRGGTATPDARLLVGIEITRTVSIDGQVVATTALGAGDAALLLVQRGAAAGAAASLPATVVQNALSGQQIQAVTSIDVTATSLRAWGGLALQQVLAGSVAATLGR